MPQAPPASIDRLGSTEVAQATLYPFVYVFGSGIASLTGSAAPFPARVGKGCSGGCAASVWAFYHPKRGTEGCGTSLWQKIPRSAQRLTPHGSQRNTSQDVTGCILVYPPLHP